MDLVDLIQTRRFLGSEFLTWLWYKSEVYEGRLNVGDRGECEVWFDDRLTLEALVVENEQSQLKGASPSVSPEAREALRQGKLPTQARIRMVYEEQEYVFSFKGADFSLTGIKVPVLLSDAEDEKFYERMYLIEDLEGMVHDLYGEFLALRLSPEWGTKFVPCIREWIASGELISYETYKTILRVDRLVSTKQFGNVTGSGKAPPESDERAADVEDDSADTAPAAADDQTASEAAPAAANEQTASEAAPDAAAEESLVPPPPF